MQNRLWNAVSIHSQDQPMRQDAFLRKVQATIKFFIAEDQRFKTNQENCKNATNDMYASDEHVGRTDLGRFITHTDASVLLWNVEIYCGAISERTKPFLISILTTIG